MTDKSYLPPPVLTTSATPDAPLPNYDAIPSNFFNGCTVIEGSTEIVKITQKSASDKTWVMFDLIGSLSLQTVQFSLNELIMYVIAADGNYIKPETVQSVVITNGQRYTVLAKLAEPKKYTIRISGISNPQILFATALLDFQISGKPQSTQPTTPYINEVGQNTTANVEFLDPNRLKPYLPAPLPAADITHKMSIVIGGQIIYWAFNHTILPLDSEDLRPLLFQPQPGRQDNHTITNPAGDDVWVDYVMELPGTQPPHPVHVHGRHFYVIGQGEGPFPGATVAEAQAADPGAFNLVNPPLRDTFPTPFAGPPGSWLALRRRSDNPGVWFMHCHIQSHIQGGMSMIIQDGVDTLPVIPTEYSDWTC